MKIVDVVVKTNNVVNNLEIFVEWNICAFTVQRASLIMHQKGQPQQARLIAVSLSVRGARGCMCDHLFLDHCVTSQDMFRVFARLPLL
jgi:hypothetical protein